MILSGYYHNMQFILRGWRGRGGIARKERRTRRRKGWISSVRRDGGTGVFMCEHVGGSMYVGLGVYLLLFAVTFTSWPGFCLFFFWGTRPAGCDYGFYSGLLSLLFSSCCLAEFPWEPADFCVVTQLMMCKCFKTNVTPICLMVALLITFKVQNLRRYFQIL